MKRVRFGKGLAILPAVALMVFAAVNSWTQGAARPSMELLDTKISATQQTIELVGQVKNISPREVSGVTAHYDFQDATGTSVKREQGHLETDPLGANKTSAFKITTPYNASIKRFNVTFSQMFGGPLATKDSRKP